MIYIALPEKRMRRPSFYLAMEEHIARTKNICEDCFFMWQVQPSVIFGRNQLIEDEVNLSYCKEHNIEIYRRKSGGGCVYADLANIMFSYITRDENVNFTFNRYINMIILMLCKLGIDAKTSGRNDILIDGKKISGNAFYHIPGHSIVHGTMLYDTNMENMVGSITPSNHKLISKGVKSVRQRIALIKDHTTLTLNDFKGFIKNDLCDKEITLTEKDIQIIKMIEKEYLSKEFILGKNPRYTIIRKRRIEGCGELEVTLEVKNEIIKKIDLHGDFFVTGDVDREILIPLIGTRLVRNELNQVLPDDLSHIITNLQKKDFIDMIL